MPDLSIEDINKAVKDSAYAAVGFGVLGFQRAQVRRRELIEQLQSASSKRPSVSNQIDAAREQFDSVIKQLEEQFDPAREQISSLLKQLEDQVEPARKQIETYAKKVDEQVAPVRKQVVSTLDEVEQRLPASTRTTFSNLRKGYHSTEDRFRSVVGLDDEAPKAKASAKSTASKAS